LKNYSETDVRIEFETGYEITISWLSCFTNTEKHRKKCILLNIFNDGDFLHNVECSLIYSRDIEIKLSEL